MYLANESGISAGDYTEISLRAKLAANFNNYAPTYSDYSYSGKYTIDYSSYSQMKYTSIPPNLEMLLTLRTNAANGFAMSVSKSGKGLKFVMNVETKINATLSSSLSNIDDLLRDPTYGDNSYKLTIDVYDNNNVKKDEYCKVFTTYSEVINYFGFDY
jgi:hypothetical protein